MFLAFKLYFCLTELFEAELFICIKMDLALNNQQWLIFHETKPNQTKPNHLNMFLKFLLTPDKT